MYQLPIHKQTGTSDCPLFAVVAKTYLLFDGDPMKVVLYETKLCLHSIKFLETNKISLFPSLNTQWPVEVEYNIMRHFCIIMNTARDEIISCDDCQEWFHISCSNTKRSHLQQGSGSALTAWGRLIYTINNEECIPPIPCLMTYFMTVWDANHYNHGVIGPLQCNLSHQIFTM